MTMAFPTQRMLNILPQLCLLVMLLASGLPGLAQTTDLHATITETLTESSVTPVHTIGVLAYRGDDHASKKWAETIVYLNKVVGMAQFKLVPLSLPEMRNSVAGQSLSFILTNPGNYIELEAEYGVSRILTMQPVQGIIEANRIGSAIVVRRDRQDLRNLDDLPGHSLMAVSQQAFGGFQVVWRELNSRDIDPFKDLSRLDFVGFPQDDIVYALRDGRVDAGVLRACLLERMIEEGKIADNVIRVLNPLQHENFDCQASTRLYPNWPLAKLRHIHESLAKRVSQVLLALPADSDAAIMGGYGGFTIPMDYQPVHDLFRELKIGPYSWMGQTSWQQLWERYWQWLVFFVLALLWGAWHMARVQHMVAVRTAQLSTANEKLKAEMDERQKAEHTAMMRQTELAHVSRISAVGELASGMAHELNQPLSAINSYAQGTALRLQAGEIDNDELMDINGQIVSQAERAGAIIQRFRGFLRKGEVACTDVNVNSAVEEALQLFASEVRRYDLKIELQLAKRLPPICAEVIQLEQVILNLLRNAAESMQPQDRAERQLIICTEGRSDRVWLSISDSGPGMPVEVAAHLFEPFFTTKSDGMGLGLSISQSIIEAQGGRLALVKNDPSGVTLGISWPPYRGEVLNEH